MIIALIVITLISILIIALLINEINKYKILFKNEREARGYWKDKYEKLQISYKELSEKNENNIINSDDNLLDFMQNNHPPNYKQ